MKYVWDISPLTLIRLILHFGTCYKLSRGILWKMLISHRLKFSLVRKKILPKNIHKHVWDMTVFIWQIPVSKVMRSLCHHDNLMTLILFYSFGVEHLSIILMGRMDFLNIQKGIDFERHCFLNSSSKGHLTHFSMSVISNFLWQSNQD